MDKKLIVDIVIVLSALGVSISVFFLLKQLFAKLFARHLIYRYRLIKI